MTKNVNAPENLRVKVSTFKTSLTFNEWAELYNVSRHYQEPPQLYQGNVSAGIKPTLEKEDTLLQMASRNFLNNIIAWFR